MRLTEAQKRMIDRLKSGPAPASLWDYSRSPVPQQLIKKGVIRRCDHPTKVDRWGFPEPAYVLCSTKAAVLRPDRAQAGHAASAGQGRR